MHDTAYELARIFFRTYARAGDPILEIGSMDVNGSMRDFRPASGHYVGVDLSPGKGVDVVTDSAARLPFKSGAFRLVVSSSAFEHDAMFWMTFLEMCRMLQPGGYIYINAPSRGYLHSYPRGASFRMRGLRCATGREQTTRIWSCWSRSSPQTGAMSGTIA